MSDAEKKTFTDAEALAFHRYPTPGKIAIVPTKPMATQRDLSLAYSPGVAVPVHAIAAEQPVSTLAPAEAIVSGSTVQVVLTVVAIHLVIAQTTVDGVVAGTHRTGAQSHPAGAQPAQAHIQRAGRCRRVGHHPGRGVGDRGVHPRAGGPSGPAESSVRQAWHAQVAALWFVAIAAQPRSR